MASEINIQTVPLIQGANVYAVIFDYRDFVWNNSTVAFESFTVANFANYAVTLTETPAGSGYYVGNFPVGIQVAGTYGAVIFRRAGSTPVTSDLEIGTGTIVWNGTGQVTPPSNNQLCSVAYAVSLMNLSALQASIDNGFISSLIDAATAEIQHYCRRDFFNQTYTDAYDGLGTRKLKLRQFPVTALTSVTYYPNTNNPVTVSGQYYTLDAAAGIISAIGYNNPSYYPAFPYGIQNIIVTYSSGYGVIPANLQLCCGSIAKLLYIQRGTDLLASNLKVGDYQAQYSLNAASVISGDYAIQEVLNRYQDQPL